MSEQFSVPEQSGADAYREHFDAQAESAKKAEQRPLLLDEEDESLLERLAREQSGSLSPEEIAEIRKEGEIDQARELRKSLLRQLELVDKFLEEKERN
jgi:hypothetical protein